MIPIDSFYDVHKVLRAAGLRLELTPTTNNASMRRFLLAREKAYRRVSGFELKVDLAFGGKMEKEANRPPSGLTEAMRACVSARIHFES